MLSQLHKPRAKASSGTPTPNAVIAKTRLVCWEQRLKQSDFLRSCWWFWMLRINSDMWDSNELLQVTLEVCQDWNPQIWEMRWITAHAGLVFAFLIFWTTALEHAAGIAQKMPIYIEIAPKQTPLHSIYAENHHRAGQSPWLLPPLQTR